MQKFNIHGYLHVFLLKSSLPKLNQAQSILFGQNESFRKSAFVMRRNHKSGASERGWQGAGWLLP